MALLIGCDPRFTRTAAHADDYVRSARARTSPWSEVSSGTSSRTAGRTRSTSASASGPGAMREEVRRWTPEEVERVTGVPGSQLERVARTMANNRPGAGEGPSIRSSRAGDRPRPAKPRPSPARRGARPQRARRDPVRAGPRTTPTCPAAVSPQRDALDLRHSRTPRLMRSFRFRSSTLAAVSVFARRTALVLADHFSDERRRIATTFDVAAVLGGILIVLFGMSLLQASLMAAKHPLL
jgi:hypothetical protein